MKYRVAVCQTCGATLIIELEDFSQMMNAQTVGPGYYKRDVEDSPRYVFNGLECCGTPDFQWTGGDHLKISEYPRQRKCDRISFIVKLG